MLPHARKRSCANKKMGSFLMIPASLLAGGMVMLAERDTPPAGALLGIVIAGGVLLVVTMAIAILKCRTTEN